MLMFRSILMMRLSERPLNNTRKQQFLYWKANFQIVIILYMGSPKHGFELSLWPTIQNEPYRCTIKMS